jgi:hypothetical protein
MKKALLRFYKRFRVFLEKLNRKSTMKTHEEVELHEKTAFKICVKVISHKDSNFMIAPMSNKRYILNETLNLFIIIDYGKVEITNHVFHYDVKLTSRDFDRVIYLYDNETESRRNKSEMEIKSNIKNSLQKVLEKIEQKINSNPS